MLFNKKIRLFILVGAVLSAGLISSCDNGSADDLPTPITDDFKLTLEYEGKDFLSDFIGIVTFRSHTDGDTTNFSSGPQQVPLTGRYLGVNTPESTITIEPWGVMASQFVKRRVENAYRIVLVNDSNTYGATDSIGNRHLVFVWYQMRADEDFRLLNLELIEQAYSRNQLFVDSPMLQYRAHFIQAARNAEDTGRRIYGERDPGWDYTNRIIEDVTIRDIREKYSNYGVTASGSSGVQLRMKLLLVALQGDHMILRDIDPDSQYEDGRFAGIYAYAGFGSGLATLLEIGDVVYFYARASYFQAPENIQLTDIVTTTYGNKKFEILQRVGDEGYDYDYAPYTLAPNSISDYDQFDAIVGDFVETRVTIRTANLDDYDTDGNPIQVETHFNKNVNNPLILTVYARLNSQILLNLRIDRINPHVSENFFEVGKTYNVAGYLTPYFDRYQLMLVNNLVARELLYEVTS
jgi:hypothetical protein